MLGSLRRLCVRFDSAVARNALAFSVFVGGAKNASIDLGVQAATGGDIDWRRVGVFGTFGFFYVGGAQFIIINRLLPRLLPGLLQGHVRPAFKAMAFDQALHMPFMYLPVFYCIRELGEASGSLSAAVNKGMEAWRSNVASDTKVQLCLFVPFQLMNFTMVPPHFRVPSLIAFGMIWVGFLSYSRGGYRSVDKIAESARINVSTWRTSWRTTQWMLVDRQWIHLNCMNNCSSIDR